jgi:hypothetical protein
LGRPPMRALRPGPDDAADLHAGLVRDGWMLPRLPRDARTTTAPCRTSAAGPR